MHRRIPQATGEMCKNSYRKTGIPGRENERERERGLGIKGGRVSERGLGQESKRVSVRFVMGKEQKRRHNGET